jgi:hypothetical protein
MHVSRDGAVSALRRGISVSVRFYYIDFIYEFVAYFPSDGTQYGSICGLLARPLFEVDILKKRGKGVSDSVQFLGARY